MMAMVEIVVAVQVVAVMVMAIDHLIGLAAIGVIPIKMKIVMVAAIVMVALETIVHPMTYLVALRPVMVVLLMIVIRNQVIMVGCALKC